MSTTIAEALRERHCAIRDTQSQALATRLHRALSWLQRAEQNPATTPVSSICGSR